jgi:hypothetical protein
LKQTLRRVGAVVSALALLAAVIYLGILSGEDNRYVVWFGIASAIAAPVGLTLMGYAVTPPESELIQRLAKVPEIDRLIREARTQEEKIQVLETERGRLAEIIRLESRRQAADDRIDSLERDAMRILEELDGLDNELRLLNVQIGQSSVSVEIQRLRDRVRARERGDVVVQIGSRSYSIDRDIIKAFPFGSGNLALASLRLIERFRRDRTRNQ